MIVVLQKKKKKELHETQESQSKFHELYTSNIYLFIIIIIIIIQ